MKKSTLFISIQDIALIGVMTATLSASKLALSFLPNIELVTLLIMLYSVCFGIKTIYAVAVFILIEGSLYGFGIWWIMYLYVWPLVMYLYVWPLVMMVTFLFRKQKSLWCFALISGCFGLSFGALCSIPYFIIGGFPMGFSYWFSGIPFDLIHCISNFVLCSVLWTPLKSSLSHIRQNP